MNAAATVRIKMRHPGPDRDGNLCWPDDADDWALVAVVIDGSCEHCETMCPDCVDSWTIDWVAHPDDVRSLLNGEPPPST